MEHPATVSQRMGDVVSRRITDAGMSLRSFSTKTGIPLTTLTRRLAGQNPFDVDELAAVALVLGTAVSDLAGEAESLLTLTETP